MQDGSAGAGGCQPACGAPKAICAGNVCVECLTAADCSDPTRPICNTMTNACEPCTSDQQCVDKTGSADPGVCMAHVDGHCANPGETIYVIDNPAICVPVTATVAQGNPGSGSITRPLCTMEQVPTLLVNGSFVRDLVVVRGTVSGGDWTYTGQGGVTLLSIAGQQAATINALGAVPVFAMSSGSAYIRDVTFSPSSSIGISAKGGTLGLDGVTVDSCMGGGILLDGAAFDIENTTVTNNGPSNDLSWGGIRVQSIPPSGSALLHLVTIENNKAAGLSCASGAIVQGNGVFASGNSAGQIASTCGVTACSSMNQTCGAQ